MSIDQHRKKGVLRKKPCDDDGRTTLQDGIGYNDRWTLSTGDPVNRADPDILMRSWIRDSEPGRVQQAEIASRLDNCNNYTRP